MSQTSPGPVALLESPILIDFADGALRGPPVMQLTRTIADLRGVFADEAARAALPQDRLAYRVQSYCPVPEGKRGGLFYGVTFLQNGLVGDEYLMTKGHFHASAETAEYYWCIKGRGILLLMDPQRRCTAQRMRPGSLHYVPGLTAHRVVNTGNDLLTFGACWPSDAGHDYASIAIAGFSARVFCVSGQEKIVEANS